MALDRIDASAVRGGGTRFKLFVQPPFVAGFEEPEIITVSTRTRAGPSDDRIYVIDAIGKAPYNQGTHPPYSGPANPAVPPVNGHFDHLQPGSRQFACAHMYGTVRRVLDIWEAYNGGTIPWSFKDTYRRLELIPQIEENNAFSGYGYLEFGYLLYTFEHDQNSVFIRRYYTNGNRRFLYCENFDVLAHELGHNLLYTLVGFPNSHRVETPYFGGFHESGGDLVAIVSSLHFDRMVNHLLRTTKGDLYSENELGHLGELSRSDEIRNAVNDYKMSNYPNYPSKEEHDLSQPLTGALFDVFVEVYQRLLVHYGAITQQLADGSFHPPPSDAERARIREAFTRVLKSCFMRS